MKLTIILAAVCCALLLGGCANQSLLTDEEYYKTKGPAANSPDPMSHIPNPNNSRGGY
jgi:PBP1b-binding outer membrane lipoprotein LpoB